MFHRLRNQYVAVKKRQFCIHLLSTMQWSSGAVEVEAQRGTEKDFVLDCPPETSEEVEERRMLAKLTSIMDNASHPLHQTVRALCSTFSSRLLHPQCKKECCHTSFLPTAVRLFHTNTSIP